MFRFTKAVLGPVALALGLLALAPGALLAQASLDGDWELAVTMPQGPNTVDLSIKQDGDKLTGTLKTPLGSLPVAGTLSDGVVTLAAAVKLQGNGIDLGLNGKVNGEALTGTVKLGDFGEFPFTGKRAVKIAAATAPPPLPPSGADAADATGSWDITLSIGGGQVPASATLKQEGGQVTGTLKTPLGDTPVRGTMVGKALRLEFSATTPQGTIPVTLTGDLDEKGFTGKMNITGMGEADWTGTRGAR